MMREYAGMAETNIEELRARIAELEEDKQRLRALVERIAELEAELDAERKRRGSLQFQYDYLQRGCADDALTIHTCKEIIDRTKKELGTYRELHFDNTKRIAELEAEREEVRLLKECIFGCLQSDSDEYIRQRLELEEKRIGEWK